MSFSNRIVSLAVLAIVVVASNARAQAPGYCPDPDQPCRLAIILDRSGSMSAVRALTGNTRCVDAYQLGLADLNTFFTLNPGGKAAIWTFGETVEMHTAGFVDFGDAITTYLAIDPNACAGCTPLAECMCEAMEALALEAPNAPAGNKQIAVSSDGGDNCSSLCGGPWSTTPFPYDDGSWQQNIYNMTVGTGVSHIRFWGAVAESGLYPVTDFLQDIADATGGGFVIIGDDQDLPDPLGACCFDDGTCEEDHEPASCVLIAGGTFAGEGTECGACSPCVTDLNGDGVTDTSDLLMLLGAWGGPDADITGDGITDVSDLLTLVGAWGDC